MLLSRPFIAAVSLVCAITLSSCGPEEEPAERELGTSRDSLLNGYPTSSHPDVGFLTFAGGQCTGTLISPRVVLTAAHCLGHRNTWNKTNLGTFGINASLGLVKLQVVRALVRTYDPNDRPNDLAIVQLASAVPAWDATPYRIATSYPPRGTPAALYGYGCTNRANSSQGARIKRRFDFAYGPTHNLCPGDSGGPQMTGISGVVGVASGYRDDTGADVFAGVPGSHAWISQWSAWMEAHP